MSHAMYVRVSTPRQAQTQTIEQQLQHLHAAFSTRDWSVSSDLIFRDDGYSGASLSRPGLDRLREHVARAEITSVLVTAPDRLARKYVHQVLLIEEFEQAGCQIEFLERPMSQDPHDQLLLQIRGAVAEYERALLTDRMRRGRQAKLQAGILLPWTKVPYGYRVDLDRPRDPAGMRLEPREAAIVAELFSAYLEPGQSIYGLTKHLLALQVLTATGARHWNPSTIRNILHNPVYTGKAYAGRTRARVPRSRRSALLPIGQPGNWNRYLIRYGARVAFYEARARTRELSTMTESLRRVRAYRWRQGRAEQTARQQEQLKQHRVRHRRDAYLADLEARWAALETGT